MTTIQETIHLAFPETMQVWARTLNLPIPETANEAFVKRLRELTDSKLWHFLIDSVVASTNLVCNTMITGKQFLTDILLHYLDPHTVRDPATRAAAVAIMYISNPGPTTTCAMVLYVCGEMGISIMSLADHLLAMILEATSLAATTLLELTQKLLAVIRREETPVEPMGMFDMHQIFSAVFIPLGIKLKTLGYQTTRIVVGLERLFKSLNTMASGCRSIDYLASIVSEGYSLLMIAIAGDPHIDAIATKLKDIEPTLDVFAFIEDSIQCGKSATVVSYRNDPVLRQKMDAMISLWKKVSLDIPHLQISVNEFLIPLEAVRKMGLSQVNAAATKFVPFCMWLYGGAGVGKSHLVNHIVKGFPKWLKDDIFEFPADPELTAYAFQYKSKYHNGYKGQWCVTMDDVCQEINPGESGSSVSDFIRIVSPVGNNMEGAAIDAKVTPFTSHILLATSNQGWPRNTGTVDGPAFLRRRNMVVEMIACDREDPYLKHNVQFVLRDKMDPQGQKVHYENYLAFMIDFRRQFREHIVSQNNITNLDSINEMWETMIDEVTPDSHYSDSSTASTQSGSEGVFPADGSSILSSDITSEDARDVHSQSTNNRFSEPTPRIQLNRPRFASDPNLSALFRTRSNLTPCLLPTTRHSNYVENWIAETQPQARNFGEECPLCGDVCMCDPWNTEIYWADQRSPEPEIEVIDLTEDDEEPIPISELPDGIDECDGGAFSHHWCPGCDDDVSEGEDWGDVEFEVFEESDDESITTILDDIHAMAPTTYPMFMTEEGKSYYPRDFSNPALAAYIYFVGLEQGEMDVYMQGVHLIINPIFGFRSALDIIHRFGLPSATRTLFGPDRLDWVLTNSRFYPRGYEATTTFYELNHDVDCPPYELWTVVPRYNPVSMYIQYRIAKNFVNRHKAFLLGVSVIIPMVVVAYTLYGQHLQVPQALYLGTGIGRASNVIVQTPSPGAISKKSHLVTIDGRGSGILVKGKWLLTAEHVLSACKEGQNLTLLINGRVFTEAFQQANYHRLVHSKDQVLYLLTSKTLPEAKNLIKSIAFSEVQSAPVDMMMVRSNKIVSTVVHKFGEPLTYKVTNFPYSYEIGNAFKAMVPCAGGDSGSPVIHRNSQKLMGIIVAGTNLCTYVEMINAEELLQIIDGDSEPIGKSCFTVLRKAETPIPQMPKSKLTPSGLYNSIAFLNCMYAPAVLSNKDRRLEEPVGDILLKSMSGYDREYPVLDEHLLDEIVDGFRAYDIQRTCVKDNRRILSFSESLNGFEDLKPFELATSPGLPWKNHPLAVTPGKRGFVEGNVPDRVSPIWEQAVDEFDFDEPILGYACLKDELRPMPRVVAGKTRSFIVLPAEYNLILRMYFGAFIAAQHRQAGVESSCVGINPYEDWDLIYNRLLAMNDYWEDFDYSDWDRTLAPQWFEAYAQRVSNWYNDGPVNRSLRIKLMKQLAFSHVQIGGEVYATGGGNKSGCAITAEINTDVHQMMMAFTWITLSRTHAPHLASVHCMFENNAFCFYGDDQVKATKPGIEWFNGNEIQHIMLDIGMTITPAVKEATTFELRHPSEVMFLKRNFGESIRAGKRLCPLDLNSINKMLFYVHKSDDHVKATQLNLETAVKELFFHGSDIFRLQSSRIMESIQNNSLPYKVPYEDWQKLCGDWINGHFEAPQFW